ncbi:MAG: hypothetical protein HKO75_00210, partial [Flavobacteriaceae bacterium]|nr:hypothetical protein [Muriicola sp.]MBT8290419.1 hypothetical protein [Muriicola sp.]NNK35617.1 hypothetical protein [Eudoraea sp.]NNL38257.1 hypothetical protein [Flavobacteriaceae bacterium]
MRINLTIIAILLAGILNGQDIAPQIERYSQSYVKTGDFSGCILIAKEGTTLYSGCFGKANLSFGVPN